MQPTHSHSVQMNFSDQKRMLLLAKCLIAVAIIGFLHNPLHAQMKISGTATSVQDSLPTPGAMGWAAFTQADKRDLELSDAQLVKLKDMDTRFEEEYKAMGIEPWTNDKFPELNRKRNQAIQDVLNPEQYQQWARPTKPVPTNPPTIMPETTP